jgi:hypothetical protein
VKSRFIPLLVVLLLTGLFVLFVHDFARQVIVLPLAYAGWVALLLLRSIPQWAFWMILILVALIIAGKSLSGGPSKRAEAPAWSVRNHGPTASWLLLLEQAESQEFSRWRLSRDLGRLAWAILNLDDSSESFDRQRFKERLLQPELNAPHETAAYFLIGIAPFQSSRRPWLWRWRKAIDSPTPLELHPSRVVSYLENQLHAFTGE